MIGSESKSAVRFASGVLENEDQRAEGRVPTSGEVKVLIDGPHPLAIPARVLDISEHGMHVEHMYAALTSGMTVEIDSGAVKMAARVVWNRINNDRVESGFYLP